jgi:hypothetical protein
MLRRWPLLTCILTVQLLNIAQAAELPGAAQFHKEIQPLLQEYCYDCHGDGEKRGGVAFDELTSDQMVVTNRDLWWTTLKYLRSGIMPPPKKDRPTLAEQQRITGWIKSAVFAIDPNNVDPGRVTLRRLNRVEYGNTVHDLLGVDFNAEIEFPPDDSGYGFDNIGDVLTLSPMLLEKYVAAAKEIVTKAVPLVPGDPAETIFTGAEFTDPAITEGKGHLRRKDTELPFDKPATLAHTFHLKRAGDYEFHLELGVRGLTEFDARRCRVSMKLDGEEFAGKEIGWYNSKTLPFDLNKTLAAGEHRLSVELQPLNPGAPGTNALLLRILPATLRGPMERDSWVKSKNYDRFFSGTIPNDAAGRREYVRKNLRNFATKAFRRPVDDKTVDRLASLAEDVYSQPGKTVEAGIAQGMEAIISSPRFLFRLEGGLSPASSTNAWSDIDEYALASRLSYFLWSTMPDDELFRLAGQGQLRKNLAAQVERMLKDPRSKELVRNFTGQWLQVRDVHAIAINPRAVLSRDSGRDGAYVDELAAFRGTQDVEIDNAGSSDANARPFHRFREKELPMKLDGDLRDAMRSETEMFFASVVQEDRDVATLIDSDYTFLNERLAALYGLTNLNVTGNEMRRVTLPSDSPRGGVLTEGTMLVVTSNPDRTSPVKRGVFVLNNILGTPTPPPPPNIPALEASEKTLKHDATLRDLLAAHRNEPMCASCHMRMDPIGLAMENFNALGIWRDTERNQSIDAAGKLVTGESFSGVRELKHILATNHRDDFYRCLTEKLLTYALGRGLEYYDVETVDRIVQSLDEHNGRFSVLLMGIIESAPFQKQRNLTNPVFAYSNEATAKTDGSSAAKN